jgi:Trypsin
MQKNQTGAKMTHRLSRLGRWALLVSLFMVTGIAERTEAMIGGRGDLASDFSSTVLFSGIEPCTAVIVGSQTVLTAGHCVDDHNTDDGGAGSIQYGPSGLIVSVLCTKYRQYPNVYDIAVCKPASSSDTFSGMNFEALQTDPNRISADSQAVLAGYGCTSGQGTDYGTLNSGSTGIESTSSNPAVPDINNPKSELLITVGGALLCEGDSGSAAFDQENPSARFIIGIGFRGQVPPKGSTDTVGLESYFVQVSDNLIKNWLQSWGDTRGIAICGIHSNATGCR